MAFCIYQNAKNIFRLSKIGVFNRYLLLLYTVSVKAETGGRRMAISYNRMWKLLVDKKMSKADLRKAADIAPNTMTKLRRDEPVNLAILGRIWRC